ncbi:inorganic phosphate transporter, partial [bacterium]|nr:inorganic phosphate transporter [bacterium]NIO73019.1 inorganic phosphate transporter [bacterium]
IATTHAIVCAVVGVGLYAEALNGRKFLDIVVWWISTPIVAWCINYVVGRYFYFRTIRWLTRFPEERLKRIFSFFLTISGCYVAFSAGSNNAANAVGPIVGIGLIDSG